MGWTYYTASAYKNGKIDRLAECRYEFGKSPEWGIILKDALVGTTYYAAIKLTKTEKVFALVALTATDKRDFGYKDMDETMHPFYYDCPIGILKLLSPTDNESAKTWREKCYERHEIKKKLNKAKKIQITLPDNFNGYYYAPGETVKLERYKRGRWVDRNKRVAFKQNDVIYYGFIILE